MHVDYLKSLLSSMADGYEVTHNGVDMVNIELQSEYEFPQPTPRQIDELGYFYGTQLVSVDRAEDRVYLGCPTCDCGSKYPVDVCIKGVTRNILALGVETR